MKNKWIYFLLAVSMCMFLAGCQLAQEEETEPEAGDQLIGGMVTVGSISTFDVESYFNAHPEVLLQNDGVSIPAGQQPIYAAVETRTLEDGTTQEVYTFPDIEGVVFYDLVAYSPEDNAVHTTSGPNQGVTDHGVGYHVQDYDWDTGDSTRTIEIGATVTYDATQTPAAFYLNPVYQTEDGKVYLLPDGSGVSGELDGTGLSLASETRWEERTPEEAALITEGTSVEVILQFRYPAEKVRLIQMDGQNREVSRIEFVPGEAPEELTPAVETAYILVEHCRSDGQEIDRELISRGEEYLYTYELQPSGFFHSQTTQVSWDQEGGAS